MRHIWMGEKRGDETLFRHIFVNKEAIKSCKIKQKIRYLLHIKFKESDGIEMTQCAEKSVTTRS